MYNTAYTHTIATTLIVCLIVAFILFANRKPREPMRLPKVDLKAKFSAMNEKVKKARMPSPHELKEGYLNSSFHRSFQQPLAVRTREIDDPEELEQRQVDQLMILIFCLYND